MMRNPVLIFFLPLVVAFIWGCSPARHLDDMADEAEKAYARADHKGALHTYERLIEAYQESGRKVDSDIYQRAGLIAFTLDETSRAIEYLEQVRIQGDADDRTFRALALSYRAIDNLSREIRMLEYYVEQYPEGDAIGSMRSRLFEALVESLNFQQAYDLWDELDRDSRGDESLMTGYLTVLQALGHQEEATDLAKEILAVHGDNVAALDWLAKRHFRNAEQLDLREREAYERNPTHRQYARLLEALEIVNTDLRIALNYFTRLYELDPSSEYASYLANIYERFQNEEKARYYRERAQ